MALFRGWTTYSSARSLQVMNHARGACLCKKVQFKVALPAHWSGHCHCTQCQRVGGSAFVTWVGFKNAKFEIADPERVFKVYNSGRADRGFCSHCGSSFYFKYTSPPADAENDWSQSVFFTHANFDPALNQKPECHIYYDFHAKWLDDFDELPKFEWSSL